MVSVVLMPSMIPTWARYGQANAGGDESENNGTCVLFPIRGGDEVIVDLPDGSPNRLPVITHRLNSPLRKLPVEWDNESVQIRVGDYPVTVRNHQGGEIKLATDGAVTAAHKNGTKLEITDSEITATTKTGKVYNLGSSGLVVGQAGQDAVVRATQLSQALATQASTAATHLPYVTGPQLQAILQAVQAIIESDKTKEFTSV
jgi:uncharacterized protein involved in type VI secretion and phage assembly